MLAKECPSVATSPCIPVNSRVKSKTKQGSCVLQDVAGKRIQVSMLAPTMYPVTSKLILMNLPCKGKKIFS